MNRYILQLAQEYCGDCKNSFDELSKIIQVGNGSNLQGLYAFRTTVPLARLPFLVLSLPSGRCCLSSYINGSSLSGGKVHLSELFAFKIIRHSGGGTLVDNTSLFSRGVPGF